MTQLRLLPVTVTQIVPSSTYGLDGVDLKWIARGDDNFEYAMKTMADHPFLPITEWVCYSLWGACGMAVPECAVLEVPGQPPAFGSRIVVGAYQVPKTADLFTIAARFRPHLGELAKLYPLDAFLPNPDRHARNVLMRPQLGGEVLVSIDFSRAWLVNGVPFGDMNSLAGSNTETWWRFFKNRMSVIPDHSPLDKISALPDDWMRTTLSEAPAEWLSGVDLDAISEFWKTSRADRVRDAKMWL